MGLPNTRNVIQKWSVDHLRGLDITSLGPPVIVTNPNYTLTHHKHNFHIPSTVKDLLNNVSTSVYYLRRAVHLPFDHNNKLSLYNHNITSHPMN